MRHEMHVMNKTGHTTVTWDRNNQAEIASALSSFESLTGQGYRAFRMDGERGHRMDIFDPAAEKVVMVPQLRGG